jgi:hypothetical protein
MKLLAGAGACAAVDDSDTIAATATPSTLRMLEAYTSKIVA